MLSFDLSYFQHVLTTSLSVHHRHHDSLGIDISSSRPHLVGEATRDLRPEDRTHAAWGMTAHPQEKDIPSHLIFDAHHAPRHGPGHVGVTKCAPRNSNQSRIDIGVVQATAVARSTCRSESGVDNSLGVISEGE